MRSIVPTHLLALILAACGLPALATPAAAITEQQAGTNLMYFAFAMKQAELCEGMGLAGMAILRRWEKKNGGVLVASLKRVEEHAQSTQKLTRDQARDVALGLFVRFKDRFDRELAPTLTQKSCVRFGETLDLYEQKLVAP
jgi:hypothetical protein